MRKRNIQVNTVFDAFVYFFPFFIIFSQNINIGELKLSWGLSVIALIYVMGSFLRKNHTFNIVLILIFLIHPLITFYCFSDADFNVSLYFSIVTGLVTLLFIICLKKESLSLFIRGCFFSCMVFAIWGIFEIYTGNYLFWKPLGLFLVKNVMGRNYPITAFINTNDLAQYLSLLLPVSSMYCYENSNKKIINRILFAGSLLLSFWEIYNADARLAMMSFIGTCFLTVIMQKKNKYIIVMLPVIAVSAILIILLLGVNIDFLKDLLTVDTSSQYFTARLELYVPLIEASIKNPFGIFGSSYIIDESGPHNLFLFFMCDYGVFYAIAFAVFLIILFINLQKKHLYYNDCRWILALLSTLIFFPLTSSISSANEQRKAVWIFIGVCVAVTIKLGKQRYYRYKIYELDSENELSDLKKPEETEGDKNNSIEIKKTDKTVFSEIDC